MRWPNGRLCVAELYFAASSGARLHVRTDTGVEFGKPVKDWPQPIADKVAELIKLIQTDLDNE